MRLYMIHTSRACQNVKCNIHWSVQEYNANNAWYYNGNNGNVNNNNKQNSFPVRPVLELYQENDHLLEEYPIPYHVVYENYLICRRKKRRKPSIDTIFSSEWGKYLTVDKNLTVIHIKRMHREKDIRIRQLKQRKISSIVA